jgi:ATPase subunit of ABC transporter with duplicated ATPase domains
VPVAPPASGGTLTATNIVVRHGLTPVLDGVTLSCAPGHRIGVVGPNGAGKTTLLRVLAGELTPESGRVTAAPPSLAVGYLQQEAPLPAGSVRASLAQRTGVAAASDELEQAASALATGEAGGDQRYADALDRYLAIGAADFDTRVAEVCDRTGLGAEVLDVDVRSLSGGMRARAGLAAILLARFDVFLLDEPTNDLDFAGLDQLEEFVAGLAGGAVIVSHDRRFLDRTVTEVVELDAHTRRTTSFGGGWQAYLAAREVARRHADERYEEYARSRDELVQRVRTQRQWASVGVRKAKSAAKDNDKAQRDFRINNTEHLASKVRISEKRLQRLEHDAVDKPWEPWQLHLSFGGGGRSGDVVARLDGATIDRGSWHLGPIDLEIDWAERVAVTGPNGSGKTTLIRALFGGVALTSGTRWVGPGVVVGELDQARARFDRSATLLDAFIGASGQPVAEARSLLAKFGLGPSHAGRTTRTLSPGERTRAVLALLMAGSVNCLILDEPTNHLDLEGIEELETALDRYEGTLVLVTHDRQLLDHVAVTRTIELTDAGALVELSG